MLILAIQSAFWPVKFGVVVRGATIGLLTALIATGMALVYRANRVVNFAQADLGYAPALLGVMMVAMAVMGVMGVWEVAVAPEPEYVKVETEARVEMADMVEMVGMEVLLPFSAKIAQPFGV